jgi:hypothetical protein
MLTKISKREFDEKYTGFGITDDGRDRPRDYCIFGGQILVGPVPDATTYTYTYSYTTGAEVSIDGTVTSVPFTDKGRREILRDGVLFRVYKAIQNYEEAGQFKAFYDYGLQQIDNRERWNRGGRSQVAYQGI